MRPVLRLCPALAVLAAAVPLTGCGEDDNGGGGQAGQPRTVTIKLTGSGRNLSFSVPKSVPGGVVRIRFTNSAERGAHSAQLGYVDEGHTAQEGLNAAGAWAEQGRPLPDWAHTAGGVAGVPAASSASVTQELPAGRYFVLDTDSEEEVAAFFDVTAAEGEAALPSPAPRIDATEYSFEATGLEAGRGQVLVENKGSEPHFLEAARLRPGKTVADVRRFFREEKGEPPADFERGFATTVIDGGTKQVVDLQLERGDYALICFVPDRKGGPPHAEKGMISQATVR
jgi:hypothetical protein